MNALGKMKQNDTIWKVVFRIVNSTYDKWKENEMKPNKTKSRSLKTKYE